MHDVSCLDLMSYVPCFSVYRGVHEYPPPGAHQYLMGVHPQGPRLFLIPMFHGTFAVVLQVGKLSNVLPTISPIS